MNKKAICDTLKISSESTSLQDVKKVLFFFVDSSSRIVQSPEPDPQEVMAKTIVCTSRVCDKQDKDVKKTSKEEV